MCLYVKDKEPNIAKCDITCYKVVLRQSRPDSDDEYYSPYRYEPISGECIDGSKNMEPGEIMAPKNVCLDETNYFFGIKYTAYIEGCMIHTYMHKQHAIKDAEHLENHWGAHLQNYDVYECIIPKGTEYYEGTDSEYRGYASKAIKFIKKVY